MVTPFSTHPTASLLASFASGELTNAAAADVRSHLKNCPACRRRVARFFDISVVRRSSDSEQSALIAPPPRGALVLSAAIGGVLGLATLVGWAAAEMDTPTPDRVAAIAKHRELLAERKAPVESQRELKTVAEATEISRAAPSTPSTQLHGPASIAKNESSDSKDRLPAETTGGPSSLDDADQQAAQEAPFFDGKTLTAWECRRDVWHVDDGAIVGTTPGVEKTGRGGEKTGIYLRSRRVYKDFDLKFRAMFSQGAGIGGVLFRSRPQDVDQFAAFGPRCVICEKAGDGRHPSGSLVSDDSSKLDVSARAEFAKRFVKPGENHFQIRCEGKQVLIKVNGFTMVERNFDTIPDEGLIAWYLEAGASPREIRIRDVQFTELKPIQSIAATHAGATSDPAVADAEKEYVKKLGQTTETLVAKFKSRIDQLRKKNQGGDVDQEIAILESEQKAFIDTGFIPWSEHMRAHAGQYLDDIELAQKRFEIAVDKAAEGARKKHDDNRVAQIKQEEESLLAPTSSRLPNRSITRGNDWSSVPTESSSNRAMTTHRPCGPGIC